MIVNENGVLEKLPYYKKEYYKKYYQKWNIEIDFKPYNIDFVEMINEPLSLNLRTFVNSLKLHYCDTHRSLAMSYSYNKILNEIDKNTELFLQIKYDERNYYFKYFIYQYSSCLDYILFIMNIIAKLNLAERKVTFDEIDKAIKGKLEYEKTWNIISNEYNQERNIINILKHRYMIGIDHLSKEWNIEKLKADSPEMEDEKNLKLKYFEDDIEGKTFSKLTPVVQPDINFEDDFIKSINRMNKIHSILQEFNNLPKIKEKILDEE